MKRDSSHKATRRGSNHPAIVAAALSVPFLFSAPAHSAETRGYVVSWFAIATDIGDLPGSCPEQAKNPNKTDGYAGGGGTERRQDIALLNGKPVPALNYPDLVQNPPKLETWSGKHAFGFDLGGPAANKMTDRDTQGKVDNQVWRAVGCMTSFQAAPPTLPYSETAPWGAAIDTAPAFALQITGEDLSKDGPVTVTMDRTLRHLERDAAGGVRTGVTYVLDPSPRSHNVLKGEIKEGILSIKGGGFVYLVGGMPFYPQIDLQNAHMRLRAETDGKVTGYWGGHTDWRAWAYTFTARPGAGADSVGLYWALKRLADADPDPKTGENRKISITWRIEAVPAFLATNADGKVVASASRQGLGGVLHQSRAPQKTASAGGE